MNRNGGNAYVLPQTLPERMRHTPYIYTEAEIQAIWNALDALKPRGSFPVRHFVIPAMVKLMYCCGLRPVEARRLRVGDVDLDKGRLDIIESKQHRSRIVMMADDVVEMLSVAMLLSPPLCRSASRSFLTLRAAFMERVDWKKTFR